MEEERQEITKQRHRNGLLVIVTNYHKFGGLKQQKCILSQFWRPEV